MDSLGNLLFYGAAIALYLLVGFAWECYVLPRLIERTVSAHFWHALIALCIGSLVGLGSFWLWPQRLVGVGPPTGISTLLAPTGALLTGALLFRAFAPGKRGILKSEIPVGFLVCGRADNVLSQEKSRDAGAPQTLNISAPLSTNRSLCGDRESRYRNRSIAKYCSTS